MWAKKVSAFSTTENILITSPWKQIPLVREFIKEIKGVDDQIKIFTCDMNPSMAHKDVDDDGCFKVPLYTSEDYVETIFSLCMGYNISHIFTMAEREFIILSANKDMFDKYGVQVMDCRVTSNPMKIIKELQLNNRM